MSFVAFIRNHLSLAIMIVGSAAVFFSNIMLKPLMSGQQYGYYGILMTFIWMINSFGLLGTDQAFIRLSQVTPNRVKITKRMAAYILISMIIGPFVAANSLLWIASEIDLFWAYMVSFGTASTMFLYNFYRIQSRFNISQLFNNGWRIGLGVFVLASIVGGNNSITVNDLIAVIAVIMVLMTFFALYNIKTRLILESENIQKGRELKTSVSFLFSLLSGAIFINYDRILVERLSGIELFGEYFYLLSLYTLPLGVIAGYVGFKSLVRYKKCLTLKMLNTDSIRVLITFILMGLMAFLVIEVAVQNGFIIRDFEGSWGLLIPLLISGMIRGVLALVSAAMGAVGKPRTILAANVIPLMMIVSTIFLLFHYPELGLAAIAWSTVALGILRYVSFYFGVKRCLSKV